MEEIKLCTRYCLWFTKSK